MVDVSKLEKQIEDIDRYYNLSKIDDDTFSAIVVLTEKKVQFKNLMKRNKIGARYYRIFQIIKSEFPNVDEQQLSWFLFKNGYIKNSTLNYMLLALIIILFLVGIVVISNFTSLPITMLLGLLFFLCCVWCIC